MGAAVETTSGHHEGKMLRKHSGIEFFFSWFEWGRENCISIRISKPKKPLERTAEVWVPLCSVGCPRAAVGGRSAGPTRVPRAQWGCAGAGGIWEAAIQSLTARGQPDVFIIMEKICWCLFAQRNAGGGNILLSSDRGCILKM